MKKNLKHFALIALVAMAIASCSKKETAAPTPEISNSDKVLQYIKGLGFPESSIVDKGNEYIVEEDISFPKDMVVPNNLGKPNTEAYYTGSIVNATNKLDIKVFVDPSMTVAPSLLPEINSAIAQWNSVPGSALRFRIVTSAPYDILIRNENLGNGVCGAGTFPSGGAAGNLIRINKAYIATNSFAQRARTICHEFGHNISFRHTNWAAIGEPSASLIPGVTGPDANSIMNGGQCGSGAVVLSAIDKQATDVLY